MNDYTGPDRRDGSLSVDRRLDRLEDKVDVLTTRVTWLFGGIASVGGILAILDLWLRATRAVG